MSNPRASRRSTRGDADRPIGSDPVGLPPAPSALRSVRPAAVLEAQRSPRTPGASTARKTFRAKDPSTKRSEAQGPRGFSLPSADAPGQGRLLRHEASQRGGSKDERGRHGEPSRHHHSRSADRNLPALERWQGRHRTAVEILRAQGLPRAERRRLRMGKALPGRRQLLRRLPERRNRPLHGR